jgi:hypothetical protein
VRKVVSTLTSNERWDQPLDGSVLATKDTEFILVPAGAIRPEVVCSRHCIVLHRGARRGGLQAWRERRLGLQVPEVLIETSANILAEAEIVRVVAVHRHVSRPLWLGDHPSIYRPRRGRFTGVPHYSPTCGGMASSAVELTAILANLVPVVALWRVLCPHRSGFEDGGVVVGRLVVIRGQARGGHLWWPVRGTTQTWRRPAPVLSNSVGVVVAVRGAALQGWGWPHRIDSDGDDRSRRPDIMV